MTSPYDTDLGKTAANYQALTPLVFLERAAGAHPDHTAIIHGRRRYSYAQFYARSRRLASVLAAGGLGKGDTVDQAIARFAAAYADQNERDYAELQAAVHAGRLQVERE